MATKIIAIIDGKCEQALLTPYPVTMGPGVSTTTDGTTGKKTYAVAISTYVKNADGSYTWTSANGQTTLELPSVCQGLKNLPDNGNRIGG